MPAVLDAPSPTEPRPRASARSVRAAPRTRQPTRTELLDACNARLTGKDRDLIAWLVSLASRDDLTADERICDPRGDWWSPAESSTRLLQAWNVQVTLKSLEQWLEDASAFRNAVDRHVCWTAGTEPWPE